MHKSIVKIVIGIIIIAFLNISVYLLNQQRLYQLYEAFYVEKEIVEAKAELNAYERLVEMIQFENIQLLTLFIDENKGEMDTLVSQNISSMALIDGLKKNYYMNALIILDPSFDVVFSSVDQIQSGYYEQLKTKLETINTDEIKKNELMPLGFTLGSYERDITSNLLYYNESNGLYYVFKINMMDIFLVKMPQNIYQELYVNVFNGKYYVGDMIITHRIKYFDSSDTLDEYDLNSEELIDIENGKSIITKIDREMRSLSLQELNDNLWMSPTKIIIENHFVNYGMENLLRRYNLEIILVTFIPMLLIALYLYFSIISKPVLRFNRLLKDTQYLVEKNYDRGIQVEGNDEISELGMLIEQFRVDMISREKFIGEMAYYDTITGVGNIYLLEERLNENLKGLKKEDASPYNALVIFEIKNIEDQFAAYGGGLMHQVYSTIIAEMQGVFGRESVFRKSDYAFAAISNHTFEFGLIRQVESLLDRISNLKIEPFIEPRLIIAKYPEHGTTPKILLQNIEIAMQDNTGDKIIFYSNELKEKYQARLTLENDLKEAVQRNELFVVFQPVVSPNDNKIKGVEALVRWKRKSGDFVSPDIFIEVAEKLGIISDIDRFVFRKAIEMLMLWSEIYDEKFYVSINTSPLWFTDPAFIPFIKRMLSEYPVDPNKISLEIIETCLIENVVNANDILEKLQEMHLNVALDDFGKGFSSLNYLRLLNIDKLKIDKDFLSEMDFEGNKYNIIDSIVDMAHNLKLSIVAEGVETIKQVNYLKSRNVELIQGYYYSRPIPKEEISKILLSGGNIDVGENK